MGQRTIFLSNIQRCMNPKRWSLTKYIYIFHPGVSLGINKLFSVLLTSELKRMLSIYVSILNLNISVKYPNRVKIQTFNTYIHKKYIHIRVHQKLKWLSSNINNVWIIFQQGLCSLPRWAWRKTDTKLRLLTSHSQ